MSRISKPARILFSTRMLAALLVPAALIPVTSAQSVASAQPVASTLSVQKGPVIGTIDFYGLRKVTEAKVRQALGVGEGGALPSSKGDVEEKLDQIPGVVQSHLEAICCDGGKITLYVGIEERGGTHFELHEPPDGDVTLPDEINSAYRRFLEAYSAAARYGYTKEDLTKGYARSEDPETRAIQDIFPSIVADHLPELQRTLRMLQRRGSASQAA